MVWVRERTTPTGRPPFVGEVIANFCGWRVPRSQRDGSPRPYSRFSRQEPLLFCQVASQLYSRGWVDHVPDPIPFFFGSARNRTRASGPVASFTSNWTKTYPWIRTLVSKHISTHSRVLHSQMTDMTQGTTDRYLEKGEARKRDFLHLEHSLKWRLFC
jgi:hypothetical protein